MFLLIFAEPVKDIPESLLPLFEFPHLKTFIVVGPLFPLMGVESGADGLVRVVVDDDAGESDGPKFHDEDGATYVSLNDAGFGSEDMVCRPDSMRQEPSLKSTTSSP